MASIPETAAARKALKVSDIRAILDAVGVDSSGTKPVLLGKLEDVRRIIIINSSFSLILNILSIIGIIVNAS